MMCPLCGFQFEEMDVKKGCDGCPMSKGCHRVKCPNCGYEVAAESRLIRALKNLRRKKADGA